MRKPKVIEAAADKAAAPEPPMAGLRRPKSSKRTSSFDVALGARIRVARFAAHMSQTVLGQAVGVSFQQVQKYELGRDRISASALHAFAEALGVHPGTFFDDTPGPVGGSPDLKAAMRSAELLQRIRNPLAIKHLLALAKVLADAESAGSDALESTTKDGRRGPVP